MIVHASLFYQRQEQRLTTPTNETAARAGVANATDWLAGRGYRVIVSIQNELGGRIGRVWWFGGRSSG